MSPIRGLTNRGLSFPEIGHIRKGILVEKIRKDGSKYTVPQDLEYFRVEFDEQEEESKQKFVALYGNEPDEVDILLPFNDLDRTWTAYLEAYTAGRMIARSDGEWLVSMVNTKTGEWEVLQGRDVNTGELVPHPPDNVAGLDYEGKPVEFDPVGRLKVIVPGLARAAYLTVHTTSYHDIANIDEQLRGLQALNGGVIAGVPLVLRRRPKMISTPDKSGKRVRREKWLLSIEADPTWVEAKLSEVKRLALPNGEGLPDLTGMSEYRLPQGRRGDPDVVEGEVLEEEVLEEEEEDISVEEADIIAASVAVRHPEDVRNMIRKKGKEYGDKAATDKHGQLLARTLNTCVGGEETKRYELSKWLFGKASTKDMHPGEIKAALVDWLGVTDWDAIPSEQAIREANVILEFALGQAGQKTFDLKDLED